MNKGLTIAEIKVSWKGHEEDILRLIGGLTTYNLSGRHQPCPTCGGKDRYRAVRRSGRITGEFHCGNGHNGDLIDHIVHLTGLSTGEAISAIKRHLGLDNPDENALNRVKSMAKKRLDIAEFKAKAKQYNLVRDEELISAMEEMINTIADRRYKLPPDREVKLAYKLIGIIVKRYMGMGKIRSMFQAKWDELNG